jgi:hypothetical protein
MAQFIALDPNVEVNGQTVLSVVDGMGAMISARKTALEILRRNGIQKLHKAGWYKQQDWLNAFKEISDKIGARTLFLIGRRIPKNAKFPDDISSLRDGLESIDIAYHMNHRGGEIGHYQLTGFDEAQSHATMVCNNPYPCDFDRGIIDQIAQQFKPLGISTVKVEHDDTQPCRKKGAESCTYRISW